MNKEQLASEREQALKDRMSKVRAARKPKVAKQEVPVEKLAEENEFLRKELQLVEDGELSKVERRQIEEEVRKEIRLAQRKEKKEALRKQIKKRIEQEKGISEGEEDVYIDLAKHAAYIMLDGVQFLHGHAYRVRSNVAIQMRDIMQSGFYHQAEIEGNQKRYYTKRNRIISPQGTTTSSMLQV